MAGARAGTSTPIGEGQDVTDLDGDQEAELKRGIEADLGIGEDAPEPEPEADGDDLMMKEKPAAKEKLPAAQPKKDLPPPPTPKNEPKDGEPAEPPPALFEEKKPDEPVKKIYDGIDKDQFIKTYGPKAGKVFEALKNDLAAVLTENAELKKKPAGEAPADYAELKTKYDTAQKTIARLNLQESEGFQQDYDAPIGEAFEDVKSYIKELGLPEGIATAALQRPVKDRLAFLESVVKGQDGKVMTLAATTIATKIDGVSKLISKRAAALQNFQVTAAEQKKKQSAGGQLLAGQQRKQLLESALVEERKANNFMLTEVPGQEDWNRAVAVHTATAQRIIESSDAAAQVRHILKGVAYDSLAALYKRRNERVRALEAEIADYKDAHGQLDAKGSSMTPRRPGQKTTKMTEMTGAQAVEAMENTIE